MRDAVHCGRYLNGGDALAKYGRGFSIDNLARIACPVTSTELANWFAFAGVSNPLTNTAIFGFQDAASPIADLATGAFPLNQVSTNHLYQQPFPGFGRLAAKNIYTAVDNGLVRQHLNLLDPATNSFFLSAWVALAATPTADCGLLSTTDGAIYAALKQTTLLPAIGNSSGESSRGSIALPSSGAFPIALKYDITNKVHKFYGPSEIINRSFALASANQGEVDFGVALASGIFAATALYGWGMLAMGPSAEILCNDIGKLWTAAGWSPAWHGTPTKDATLNLYWPLDKSQWSALSGVVVPQFNWSLQETSGLVFNDYIGSVGNTPLTKGGTNGASATLGNTATGTSRKTVKTTDGTASQVLSTTCSLLPSLATTSCAVQLRLRVNAAASGVSPFYSWVGGIGSGQALAIHVDPSGHFGIDVASFSHVTGTVPQLNTWIDVLLVYDKAGSRIVLYTPGEKIVGTYNALGTTAQGVYVGSNSGSVPAAGIDVNGVAVYSGSVAEGITDAVAHNHFVGLGYSGPSLPF